MSLWGRLKHGAVLLAVAVLATGGDRGISSPLSTHYRFASGRSALQIPFGEDDGHIFIKVRINESGPLWFGVDTGAIRSVIDTERARALGLLVEGTQQVAGACGTEQERSGSRSAE